MNILLCPAFLLPPLVLQSFGVFFFFFNARWCAFSTPRVNSHPKTLSVSVCSSPLFIPLPPSHLCTSNFWGSDFIQSDSKTSSSSFPVFLPNVHGEDAASCPDCASEHWKQNKKSIAIYNCLTHICNGHLHTCAKTRKTFPVAHFWHFRHLKKRKTSFPLVTYNLL